MDFTGKVALVTGASRGIGAAIAKKLAAHGAAVAVNYFGSEEAAREVVRAIEAEDGRAIAVKADARDRAQVEAMADTVRRELGTIDCLVINASIGFPVVPFNEYPWDAFEAKLVGELGAAFHACRAVVPQMLPKKAGAIVAITSGLARNPGRGFCAHSAAKAGLEGFVRSLALELGPAGIRVNAVAPGLTLTDATAQMPEAMKAASAEGTPLRRNAVPDDLAEAVVGVLGAGFVSGATIPVNGGSYIF